MRSRIVRPGLCRLSALRLIEPGTFSPGSYRINQSVRSKVHRPKAPFHLSVENRSVSLACSSDPTVLSHIAAFDRSLFSINIYSSYHTQDQSIDKPREARWGERSRGGINEHLDGVCQRLRRAVGYVQRSSSLVFQFPAYESPSFSPKRLESSPWSMFSGVERLEDSIREGEKYWC